jgi:hypothetical protein
VNQLGASARCCFCKIRLFQKNGFESSGGGINGNTQAGCSSANHNEIPQRIVGFQKVDIIRTSQNLFEINFDKERNYFQKKQTKLVPKIRIF